MKSRRRDAGDGRLFAGLSRARRLPVSLAVAVAVAVVVVGGCDGMPRDPEGSLERAQGGVLRVGVSGAPPYVERRGPEGRVEEGPDAPQGGDLEASGPEADLLRGFARSIGGRVLWVWGPLDDHMERIQRFELDLIAAGLTEQTAWSGKVGLTVPWLEEGGRRRVLAVAPGENALLSALERYIRGRARAHARSAADTLGP